MTAFEVQVCDSYASPHCCLQVQKQNNNVYIPIAALISTGCTFWESTAWSLDLT